MQLIVKMALVGCEWQNLESNTLKTYPSIYSRTLAWVTGCAQEVNVNSARTAFERYCPKIYKIMDIRWQRSTLAPYCRWRVEYNLNDNTNLPEEGYDLKSYDNLLRTYHPQDTEILEVIRSTNVIVTYGVHCACEEPIFDVVAQSPVQLLTGTLEKNLNNMKIVDDKTHIA